MYNSLSIGDFINTTLYFLTLQLREYCCKLRLKVREGASEEELNKEQQQMMENVSVNGWQQLLPFDPKSIT